MPQSFDQEIQLVTADDVVEYLEKVFPDTTTRCDSIEQLWEVKGQVRLIQNLKQKLSWQKDDVIPT